MLPIAPSNPANADAFSALRLDALLAEAAAERGNRTARGSPRSPLAAAVATIRQASANGRARPDRTAIPARLPRARRAVAGVTRRAGHPLGVAPGTRADAR